MAKLQIFVSEDGNPETTEETNDTVIATKGPGVNNLHDETIALIAEGCAKDYEEKAEICLRRVNRLDDEIEDLVSRNQKLKRRIRFWKRSTPVNTVVHAIVGAIAGIMLAISQVLRFHGPTVTFFGTIGAFGIYLLSGLFLAIIFGWIGREESANLVFCNKEELEQNLSAQAKFESQKAEYQNEAERLRSLAKVERTKAEHYRELI